MWKVEIMKTIFHQFFINITNTFTIVFIYHNLTQSHPFLMRVDNTMADISINVTNTFKIHKLHIIWQHLL